MKKLLVLCSFVLFAISLAACGGNNSTDNDAAAANASQASTGAAVEAPAEPAAADAEPEVEAPTEQTITYLGVEYTVPAEVNNIVAASLESMEDAAILGIKPVGVLSIADAIPTYLANELEGAALVGDKRTPNNEAILTLDPDVILGSSKHGEEVLGALNKIATAFPYSHISTDWKDNLKLLAQLTGKEAEADAVIADYETKSAEAKAKVGDALKDKQIVIIRIRAGVMNVYPDTVYLNPVLYEDLGATVPNVITAAAAQADLSLEALAEANPDYIFLQFETSENPDAPAALDDLLGNPIFKSVEAAKNNHVFVNVVDPLAQGGTGWSKVKFLDAAIENLLK